MSSPAPRFAPSSRFAIFLVVVAALSVMGWSSDSKKSAPAPAPHPAPQQHAPAPQQHSVQQAPHAGQQQVPRTGQQQVPRTGQQGYPGQQQHQVPVTGNSSRTTGGAQATRTNSGMGAGANTGNRAGGGNGNYGHAGGYSAGSGAHPSNTYSSQQNRPGAYRPPANAQETHLRNGGSVYHDAQNNRTVRTDAAGHVTHITAQRGLAGSMTINRTHYGRVIETGRPGSRVVNYGPHRGFVERPLRRGYYSRTYVYGGRRYATVYREYNYRGYAYYRYVPAYYYGPHFYYWAGNPWPAPVTYAWGGPIVSPWIYAYPAYFQPAAVYASPDLWLTDYIVAQNLQAAYESQQAVGDANAAAANANAAAANANAAYANSSANSAITPEVRQAIADEVRQQIASEQAAAAQTPASQGTAAPANPNDASEGPGGDAPPPALALKFFVVSSPLDLASDGQPCSLTPGDIIERRSKDADADGNVKVEVVSAKPGDCTSDADLQVKLADLQEMHNQFRENIDAGLKVMASNDATNKGLPKAPAADARNVAEGTCTPASDADTTLLAQESDAQKLEAQIAQN
ncbi:MAG TPA: hypothetical protein VLW48_03940 [Candidatus Bathyarchaeia archaeon]|nr:hypothetical protein [Candidatus Bathyarchaeia archaeon]